MSRRFLHFTIAAVLVVQLVLAAACSSRPIEPGNDSPHEPASLTAPSRHAPGKQRND
jgi:hypothetical protein